MRQNFSFLSTRKKEIKIECVGWMLVELTQTEKTGGKREHLSQNCNFFVFVLRKKLLQQKDSLRKRDKKCFKNVCMKRRFDANVVYSRKTYLELPFLLPGSSLLFPLASPSKCNPPPRQAGEQSNSRKRKKDFTKGIWLMAKFLQLQKFSTSSFSLSPQQFSSFSYFLSFSLLHLHCRQSSVAE